MKKILIAGDVEGNFEFLISKIDSFKQKNQLFDFCLCVGKTLSPTFNISEYISNKKSFPLPIYFIDSSELCSTLLTLYPNGTTITENFHFLGKAGVKSIQGLNVAFLSGLKSEIESDIASNLKEFSFGVYEGKDISNILIQKEAKEYKSGIDILLTSEWPLGFDSNVDSQLEKSIVFKNQDVANLARFLKPRYHFVGLENVFYKRQPYINEENSYVTRLISIAKVPKDSTVPVKHNYLFALQMKPISELTSEEILARTVDTTNNPYLSSSFEIKKGADPYKQTKTEETKVEQVEELKENVALYFSGFDRRTKDVDIQEFLERWGRYSDFQLLNDAETGRHRGTGFVLFQQLKTTQQALRESGKYSLHGKKIFFSKANKGAIEGGKLATQNSECWFCLDNPNVAKDLIVFLGENLYVALDKGPINQHHLLIIPIDHYSNATALPLKISDELQMLKAKIAERYEKQYGELVIFYERYIRVTHNIAHMIINAVPYKKENFALFVEDIEKKMMQARYNTFEMKPDERLSDLVLEHEYYFYIEMVNPESRQNNQYYAKRYLLVMKEKEVKNFPKDFGRELCCDVLNCRNRIDWKNCILNENETKNLGLELKKLLNK